MAEFSKLYLTKKGQALMAKIVAGASGIEFTKVSTSSKVYAESTLENLTALDQVRQTNKVIKVSITNGTSVKVESAFTNETLTAGYYLRSLGLYAKDPTAGEILYAVCVETSGLCYMPAYNGVTVSSAYIQLYTTVGNSDNVSLSVYSGAYATVEDIDALEKEIADLQAFVGFTDSDIYGVEVDFKNRKFTRLAGAVGKAGGSSFDAVHAFGGRRRCNVTNDGKVIAYYGDTGFSTTGKTTKAIEIESGANAGTYAAGTVVQVMVEQPAFYYKVVPLELEQIDGGKGYHMRKARYYVTDTQKAGFKLHPAFISNGVKKDRIYLSAFEACLWDTSASAYILNDEQIADFTADMLSSIGGAKPASGLTQNLTRENARKLIHNRGAGWEPSYCATVSASQMLMLVEYASFNMQAAIGAGNVNKTDDGASNMTEITGTTTLLGNKSGAKENANGIQIVTYRGEENFWGNIWTFVDGMNINAKGIHELYVADHDFADSKLDGAYTSTGITLAKKEGFVSAFGYNEAFDWLFITSEVKGNSALPVGDYFYQNNTFSAIAIALLGASWSSGAPAGAFGWRVTNTPAERYRYIGARSVYIPA